MKDICFHHHTRDEIAEYAAAGCAAVIPLAATEQHGPHLPVYTDSLICEYVVTEAVRRVSEQNPLLMTPVFSVGCSDHHLQFNGTISFRSTTYLGMLTDIAESLVRCGFRKLIFVNGHGGNERIMIQVASDIAVKHPVWTASASYWTVSGQALQDAYARDVGMVPGHAGGFETALIMALRSDLLRSDKITDSHTLTPWFNSGIPGFIGKHGMLTGYDGYTDAANLATEEKGRAYLNAIVTSLSDWLHQVTQTMSQGE
ncbi:creatininase family protein [Paenibacillus sp. HJGM_3]|uniref:creatininase family protein n=1 Tax=Paenibacillus sp. HJGM_3 TaxID=3379816 RepID=UPI00385B2212